MRRFKFDSSSLGLGIILAVVFVALAALNKIEIANPTPSAKVQPQTSSCTSYQPIDTRTWLEIIKDPDTYSGDCITVYGEVTQLDSATDTFRANIGGDDKANAVLTGDATTLSSIADQDLFTANVMVLGSYISLTPIDVQIGSQSTAPKLQLNSIQITSTPST